MSFDDEYFLHQNKLGIPVLIRALELAAGVQAVKNSMQDKTKQHLPQYYMTSRKFWQPAHYIAGKYFTEEETHDYIAGL